MIEHFAKKTQGRAGRPSGGLITAIRTQMSTLTIEATENLIHVKLPHIDTSIVNAYFPPDTDIYDIISQITSTLSSSQTGKNVIVAGDFNSRIDSAICDRGEILEEGLKTIDLELITQQSPPTYVDNSTRLPRKSTIDLIFSNVGSRLIDHQVRTEVDAAMPRKHRQIHSRWLLGSGNCGKLAIAKFSISE